MKYVVVDLEMNRLANQFAEEKAVCGMEIIAIGAVLLDEQYREIEAFKTLVKPQYNDVIDAYYTRLTGITTEMVENKPVNYIDCDHKCCAEQRNPNGNIFCLA